MSDVSNDEYRGHLFAVLPMKDADEVSDDEEDVVYCDGDVWFHGSVIDDELDIHDLISMRVENRGARRGVGRAAMDRLRPHFSRIAARQVGENPDFRHDTPPLDEQPSFLFWKTMLAEGLVDEIYIGYSEQPITRDNMFEPVETMFGPVTAFPSERPVAYA